MVVLVRRMLGLWVYFAAVIIIQSGASATMTNGPNSLLKGLKIISYSSIFKKTFGSDDCVVDRQNLDTALQFMANQSSGLRMLTYSQAMKRADELYDDVRKHQADRQAADDYNLMPQLHILFTPIQTASACTATIRASLEGYVGKTYLIPTKADMFNPMVEIWSAVFMLSSAPQTFSNDAINVSEQILKELVNDWSASQTDACRDGPC
jgi:hypothetical protein